MSIMRKNIQRKLRGFCCVALAVVMTFADVPMSDSMGDSMGKGNSTVAVAEAASTTGRVAVPDMYISALPVRLM